MLNLLLLLFLPGCSEEQLVRSTPSQTTSGEFSILTYNVAGLPQGISASDPEKNIPLISPLLNKFDIALVQEDFFYHAELQEHANHPFKSTPSAPPSEFTSGDGLNRFSVFPFRSFQRQAWEACSNTDDNDCFATKGFSVAGTEVAPGVLVDIYNLHLDAGGSDDDFAARTSQIAQLVRTIKSRSAGKAIIVAGDVNLHLAARPQDASAFQTFINGAFVHDACQALSCGRDMVDRVFFKSGSSVTLEIISWETDPNFVDGDGKALSDHEAVAVTLRWMRD